MTYFYFDKTAGRELIFSHELERLEHTEHDANKAFKTKLGYDPVTADHIEIQQIEPNPNDGDC